MNVLVKRKKMVKHYGRYDQSGRGGSKDYRIVILTVFFVLFGVIIALRLYNLQVHDHEYYTALASGQHEIFKQLYPTRGAIYVRDEQGKLVDDGQDHFPMALNKSLNLLYAVPKEIKDPEAVLVALKEVFSLEYLEELEEKQDEVEYVFLDEEGEPREATAEELENIEKKNKQKNKEQEKIDADKKLVETWKVRLSKENDPYEPLKHLVEDKEINLLESYNLEGVYWTNEISRFYPEKELGSQLIGFVGKQSENNVLKGYYGVESCYNKTLAGDAGFLRSELDTFGRWIATAGQDFRQAEAGKDVYLTIDKSIQYYVCNELNKAVEYYEAISGSVVVMNPQTGELLAMCNSPEFDPNKYNEIEDLNAFNNRILTENYEPGSVFKPITMAAAIDTGSVDPFTGYQDTGEVKIEKYTIRNSDLKANGWQTMTQVLEKSLNTGTIFAARKVGQDKFKEYVENFGFGSKTNVDLCLEDPGNVTSLETKHDIYLATASFGQGLTVTPMQLVKAFGAIANDGKMMEPYVVDKIVDGDGNIVEDREPKIVGQVISPQTSKLVGSMLVSVVKNGHATKAGVEGYLVGGKTGTAQVSDNTTGGYSKDVIHTFAGSAPFDNPVFTMVVKLDHVKKVPYSSDSAAPLFGKIAKFILDYYEVPPEVK
jgi:cell division protein FtsI/penicillin-binding protein 2